MPGRLAGEKPCCRQCAAGKQGAILGNVRQRELFALPEKMHLVHAGHTAAAQGVNADLARRPRAARPPVVNIAVYRQGQPAR